MEKESEKNPAQEETKSIPAVQRIDAFSPTGESHP